MTVSTFVRTDGEGNVVAVLTSEARVAEVREASPDLIRVARSDLPSAPLEHRFEGGAFVAATPARVAMVREEVARAQAEAQAAVDVRAAAAARRARIVELRDADVLTPAEQSELVQLIASRTVDAAGD